MIRIIAFILIHCTLVTAASAHHASDAELVALEFSGERLAPPELVAEVDSDLQQIRAFHPVLQQTGARVPWVVGELLIALTPEAAQDFQDGNHPELAALNSSLGVEEIDPLGSSNDVLLLIFTPHYNPELLLDDYLQVEGVLSAQPNFLYGDGSDITREGVGTYLFKYGWGDCLSGCAYEHFWRVQVLGTDVSILDQWGPLVGGTDVGPTPSHRLRLHSNVPNPFNPRTAIRFEIPGGGREVSLRVYDLAGRHVRTLVDGFRRAGPHDVVWDGSDSRGLSVASGVYLYRLQAGDEVRVRRMALIE